MNTIANNIKQRLSLREPLQDSLDIVAQLTAELEFKKEVDLIQELEKVKGTKILVLGALQREPHISHLTIEEAIELAQKIQPEQTYFTHLSHRLGKHEDIIKTLPKNITLAFDGLVLSTDDFGR